MGRNSRARGLRAFGMGCMCLLFPQATQAQINIINFGETNYPVSEAAGSAVITVVREGIATGVVAVAFETGDGTAIAGTDYVATNGVLTFTPLQRTNTFSVTILNDTIAESNETVNLTLKNPTGDAILGTQRTAVLTIIDDDSPMVQFATTSYSVSEGGGSAIIAVTRTGPTNSAVTVDFATSNGSAIAGSDYVATNGTLEFAAGQITNTFSVTIKEDSIPETDETVNLILSNPGGGAVLGSVTNAVLTILDNEPPTLQFSTNRYSQVESAGSAMITVVRLGSTAGALTVDYATSDGTAVAGSDYLATSGTLNFSSGVGSQTFSIAILNDPNFEDNETVNVTLSNPTGATLGNPSQAVLTIVNDDGQTVSFFDEDDDYVTVTLKGHGTMAVSLVNGNRGPVDSISLSETDGSTALRIRVKKARSGDGLLKVGEIVGNGALRTLDAKLCDLVGNGIDLPGQFADLRSAISLHVIADGTVINLGSSVKKLEAAAVGFCDIFAPAIDSLAVKGDKGRGIAGDFMAVASLAGDGTSTNSTTLNKLVVKNAISNAVVNIALGNVGNVRATAILDSAITAAYSPNNPDDPMAGGTFAFDLLINSVSARGPSASFRNSYVIASQVGSVKLASVQTDNSGVSFGVLAPVSLSSVKVKTPQFRWSPDGADDQSLGDFHVKR